MFKVVEVKPLKDFRLWLRFCDGVTGEVDLSDLAGEGVFAAWNQPGEFARVTIGTRGELCWAGDLDLCPDSLYLTVTGKNPEDIFPALAEAVPHAGN
jgi:hypothetical protein